MKLGELINTLADNAGIDKESDSFKMMLAGSYTGEEIPDEIATAIKKGNLSLESAKHHPTIKAHYNGNVYGTVDTKLRKALAGILPDESVSEIFETVDKTPDRIIKAFEVVKNSYAEQLEKATASASTPEEVAQAKQKVDEYARQISELRTQLETSKAESQTQLQQIIAQHENEKITSQIVSRTAKYKLPETSSNLLRSAILGEIQKHVVFKNEGGELIPYSANDPNLRYSMDNQLLTTDQVLDHFFGPHVQKNVSPVGGIQLPNVPNAGEGVSKKHLRAMEIAQAQLNSLANKR